MEIAHISDIHVRATARVPWWRYLNKRFVGGLNMLRASRAHPVQILEAVVDELRERPPDHLVLTGDLTNLALDEEFAAAREHIARIGLPPERVSIIPGNHDAYVRAAHQRRRFEHHLADWIGGEDVRWPRVQRQGEVLIVSTSSGVPTPWFVAHGLLGPEQLAATARALAAPAAYKVLLVHHPPLMGHGRPDRAWRGNLDSRALVEMCLEHEVDLVLCGHTHHPFKYGVAGGKRPLWIVCAGSTTKLPDQVGSTACYNRYRLAPDGERLFLAALEVRGWDPAAQRLVPVRVERYDEALPAAPAAAHGSGSERAE